ncbi:unnamed protein product, partial [Laminaria digitata]
MKARIRILPVIIFTATLALTLKVGGIWQGNEVAISTATAAETEANPDSLPEKNQAPKAGPKAGKDPSAKDEKNAPKSAKTEPVGDAFDPTSVTQAEFQVLQRLANRRTELDKLRRDLA